MNLEIEATNSQVFFLLRMQDFDMKINILYYVVYGNMANGHHVRHGIYTLIYEYILDILTYTRERKPQKTSSRNPPPPTATLSIPLTLNLSASTALSREETAHCKLSLKDKKLQGGQTGR